MKKISILQNLKFFHRGKIIFRPSLLVIAEEMISNVCPEDEFVSGFRAYTHPVPDLGLRISSPVDQAMQGMETAAAQNDPETPCRGSAVKGTCSVEGFTLKRNKMLSPGICWRKVQSCKVLSALHSCRSQWDSRSSAPHGIKLQTCRVLTACYAQRGMSPQCGSRHTSSSL